MRDTDKAGTQSAVLQVQYTAPLLSRSTKTGIQAVLALVVLELISLPAVA
jgi:hypothetical protein